MMSLTVRSPILLARRGRWDRLREAVSDREALLARIGELERLRETLPDATELRHRVQPLVTRAAVRRDALLPPATAFLYDRLPARFLPARPVAVEPAAPAWQAPSSRTFVPAWLVAAGIIGGVIVGIALATSSRRHRGEAMDLEASADKIKGAWPAILDDDIREAKGSLKKLSAVIEERTGEDRDFVQERLAELTAPGPASANGHAPATAS